MPAVPKDRGQRLMNQSKFLATGLRVVKEERRREQQRRLDRALEAWRQKGNQ